jgi:hypothetical protein
LAEELRVSEATEDELYQAMDWLLERQPRIEKKLAERHLREGSLVVELHLTRFLRTFGAGESAYTFCEPADEVLRAATSRGV